MQKGLIILATIFFFGCNSDVIVSDSWSDEAAPGWPLGEKVSITASIEDGQARYNLIGKVKHSTDYAFENLYVQVGNVTPSGDTLRTPVSLELSDKRGIWQGTCRGTTCEALIPLRSNFYFEKPGTYTIWLEPYMRVDTIQHVQEVSLELRRANQKD